jgi:hypothetical protein
MEEVGAEKTTITIAIQNLRLKHEVDPNTQSILNKNLFTKNINQISYSAGELIMFANYRKLGLVIETAVDSLKVLDEQNKLVNVKVLEVCRKINMNPKNVNSIDCDNNAISRMTYVKIKDRNDPMRGHLGEIR